MCALFFFSVSLLCSALSMKLEALNEAKAYAVGLECAPRLVLCSPARAPLNQGETQFYPALAIALAQLGCRGIAQIHLPAVTARAEPLHPIASAKRALAALRYWEADFAICRGDSSVIVAVVRLRSADDSRHESQRAKLGEDLDRALAAARIPVVPVAEAASYDSDRIASLIRPYIAETSGSPHPATAATLPAPDL